MKKRNLKSLKLNKKSVSNLSLSNVKGGLPYVTFGVPCNTDEYWCHSNLWACPTYPLVCGPEL
ncbi:hypothetical protein [Kordia sp.]|uniref:hypothetical protein n=1 Tax=Kordia sp. TaxID=1965332 RepID=UPI003D27516D